MDIITQDAYHRQRMVKYFQTHSAQATAVQYKVSRKTVYKWADRYDGTIESLKSQSRRPHTHPKAHTEQEIRLIRGYLRRFKCKDLILIYQRLVEHHGYTRSYGGFKRTAERLMDKIRKKKRKPAKAKPYQRADYPGQKMQLDVKYVPIRCAVNGQKYYQFTAVDECSRWTYREIYDEHSTYSAKQFLENLVRKSPFPIRLIQTDNGTEWTNALLVIKAKHKTLFEEALHEMGIEYHRIRIATPRHNGKVERMHRTDTERFYENLRFYNMDDARKQLAVYNKKSNNYWKTCLGFQSPNQVLEKYLHII